MIQVDCDTQSFVLTFPFNKTDLRAVQDLPVRDWKKKEVVWRVPFLAVKELEQLGDTNWAPAALKQKRRIENALLFLISCKFDKGLAHPKLRPYQTTGVKFLATARKAILADDMRLGKSIQAIYAILQNECQHVLILCPSNVKWGWHSEFQKHFDIEALVIEGNTQKRQEAWQSNEQYKIANYDLLIRDWNCLPKQWDAIVADEAIYLKNHKSQRTKLAKKLQSKMKIALSGKPIELNLLEFHSICEWVRPEVVPNFYRFKYRYCEFAWDGSISGYKNLDELHMLTSPYVLRRTKHEVRNDLPPTIYTPIILSFEPKQKKAYDAIKNEYLKWLNNETGQNWAAGALERTIRLRQFVEFPSLVGFDFPSEKLKWLEELYDTIDKIVVFTFFAGSARLIRDHFGTKYYIEGGVPDKRRIDLMNEYNGIERGIFVSTDAGRFGADLSGADTLVHFGLVYNPATIRQREERLFCLNQQESIQVLTPMFRNSIDEGIQKIFLKREQETNNFLEGSEKMSIARLSKDDFRRLVEGK